MRFDGDVAQMSHAIWNRTENSRKVPKLKRDLTLCYGFIFSGLSMS